ncbi:hypothetical protein FDP41_012286 [Naegleria fowleri]|uniref:tRNA/rRNA methyltransferase SpoU type domain-containing protein n=1 Tax=Naegleria fowleri TaxID=5763 RepID=A0A6A5C8M5_NAEFO|nr:uncharacterized protein FDP41_012286 [Naegleria fowleri]KAF0981629.1 hypothetical protein FDP41_012286 [Naegleria fowleri]
MNQVIISSKSNPIIKECLKIRTKYSKYFKKCFPFSRDSTTNNNSVNEILKSDQDDHLHRFVSLPLLMNGSKIITESFEKYNIHPKWLFYRHDKPLLLKDKQNQIQYFPVTDNLINYICGDIVSNDGYCAVYDNYHPQKLFRPRKRNIYIYCYKISDPNNLGSIIRMSFGFDISAIFLSEDCVSPFTERCIRSSRNYIMNIPVFHLPLEEYKTIIHEQLKCDCTLIADASSYQKHNIKSILEMNHSQRTLKNLCLIMGNEHHGLMYQDQEFHTVMSQIPNKEFVYIPMRNNIDSFSVSHAAGILMYELSNYMMTDSIR